MRKMDDYAKELRRIRITFIILVIIMFINSGDSDVTYDLPFDQVRVDQEYKNMVPLGEGRFGILSGNSNWSGGSFEIFEYDATENKLEKINEVWLDELE